MQVPIMYKKNIFDINYDLLVKKGIKCILFDLDNTLVEAKSSEPKKEVIELIEKLSKKFKVIIVSNSPNTRLAKLQKHLKVDYYGFSCKPMKRNFKKVIKEHNFKNEEIVLIGDQFMTDILGGSRMNIKTILVDPLSDDLACTKFNRYLEEKVIKSLSKKDLFFKGKYYE